MNHEEPQEVGGMCVYLTLHWVPDISFVSADRAALAQDCPEIKTPG